MSVSIYVDRKGSGDFVVQTTATDTDTFISELAEALAKASAGAVTWTYTGANNG